MGARGGARRDVLRARPRTSRVGRACGRISIGRSLGARHWGRLARLLIAAAPFAFRRAVHGLLVVVTDKTGDYTISFKEFLCGIAPLITGTVIEKITFALELYDLDGAGLVKPFQVTRVRETPDSPALRVLPSGVASGARRERAPSETGARAERRDASERRKRS